MRCHWQKKLIIMSYDLCRIPDIKSLPLCTKNYYQNKHLQLHLLAFLCLQNTLTWIFQELSHFTSLKFFPRLLLVQKHTLRIFTGPPSPVIPFSGLGSLLLCLGLAPFQARVSPDITSYIIRARLASSRPHHSFNQIKKKEGKLKTFNKTS